MMYSRENFIDGSYTIYNQVIYDSSKRKIARLDNSYYSKDELKMTGSLLATSKDLYSLVKEMTTLLRGRALTDKLTSYEKNFIDEGEYILAKARGEV